MSRRYALRLLATASLHGVKVARADEIPAPKESARVGLELRFDYDMTQVKWDQEDATHVNEQSEKFAAASPLVNIHGRIDDQTTYRIRYSFLNDFTRESAGNDGLPTGVQYFYVTHTINDVWTLQVGKQFVLTGSWEYNYNIAELYHYSATFARAPTFAETGAQLGAHIGKQFFAVQLFNSVPESARKQSQDLIKVAAWYGNFSNGTILPIVSYAIFPRPREKIGDVRDEASATTELSYGARFNQGNFEYEVVGAFLRTPDHSFFQADAMTEDVTAVKVPSDEWQLAYGLLRYKLEDPKLEPFVKVTLDEAKTGGAKSQRFTRASAGIEYYPQASAFRYHLVYILQRDKYLEFSNDGLVAQTANERRQSSILIGSGAVF
ncbi:MAG TPA: porin [Oligoflexus sp.]|uniref:porin n=1 Tax=Oligoflexus sp. TaxID=1971216 RepID=UPI002D47E275|nr:porin [Oligoflexus sp.]HYX37764.1 porin [Oligoflexus sp.]